jgi:uncharacterized protein (TIGR02147 family)
MWKIKFRRILKREAAEARKGAERLSNRDFAAKLGLSSGALSEILSGNRKLTAKIAARVLERLDLDPAEKNALLAEMQAKGPSKRTPVSGESEELVSNWIYFATLAALELDDPPRTPTQLAKSLGVPRTAAEASLESLFAHRLVARDGNGEYSTLHRTLASMDDRGSRGIARRHARNLSHALAALREIPVARRDFTSLTFSGNSRKIAAAKKEIRKFLDKLAENMSAGGLDEVYQINIQLFPLGGWEKSNESE